MNFASGGNIHKDGMDPLYLQASKKVSKSDMFEDTIVSNYARWEHYYRHLSKPIKFQETDGTEPEEREYQRMRAIEYLKKSLAQVGTREQQLVKVEACLLLVKLYSEKSMEKDRETYFYVAVDIVRDYLWDDLENTDYGKKIIAIYLSDIDPVFKNSLRDDEESIRVWRQRSCVLIEAGSEKGRRDRLKKADDIWKYLENTDSVNDIILKLEETFGPIRLCVIWKDSSEILTSYRFTESETRDLQKMSSGAQGITVDIFDSLREYLVIIDRGNNDPAIQFEKDQLAIIYPIIGEYIKKKEHAFFIWALDNASTIEAAEERMSLITGINDYQNFLVDVIGKREEFWEYSEPKEEYIDNFLKALDICRIITLKNSIHRLQLPQEMDRILWKKIQRRVFLMVKSMLLSRNEMMNGSWYPFGVSKKKIPLEWKLYPIIRSHEALLSLYRNPKMAKIRMNEWAEGEYFDCDIYHIFLESLDSKWLFPKRQPGSPVAFLSSKLRKARYTSYIDSWFKMIELTKDIEFHYNEGRWADGDEEIQKFSFQEASRLTWKLNEEAAMRNIIAFSRHGEADSDIVWKSGNKDESLTTKGENNSRIIGKKYRGLMINILSGPLRRAWDTAKFIREGVVGGVNDALSTEVDNKNVHSSNPYPIQIVDSLTNPEKNSESFWRRKSRSRLSTIILDESTKWLVEFLENLPSPLMESTNLLITHGHPANIIDSVLENFSRQDGFYSEKTSMENGMVCDYFLQWGNKVKGLLFPINKWTGVLLEVNNLAVDIFGEIFYDPNGRQTDPFDLHDKFLDFIDAHTETSPKKLAIFLQRIAANALTKDFHQILREEGVIVGE